MRFWREAPVKDKGTRPEVEGVWPCDREGEGRRLGRNSPGRVWPGRRGVLEPKAPAERGPRPTDGLPWNFCCSWSWAAPLRGRRGLCVNRVAGPEGQHLGPRPLGPPRSRASEQHICMAATPTQWNLYFGNPGFFYKF